MNQKLTALVVDDEENARKLLQKLLEELQCFSEIRIARSSASAISELSQFDPDLIFLDVEMPGKDGFSLIEELPIKAVKPEIVMVTAYDHYALKAIKSKAFDYLLKPVNRIELKQCVQKYIENRQSNVKESTAKIARIRINTRTGTVFINPETILYCKADGNYTIICTGDKQHLCSMNLGKLSELLSGEKFIRLGRSYIINFEHISLLDRKESTVTLIREGESCKIKIPRHHLRDLDNI